MKSKRKQFLHIEGLRALAVILVILYHADIPFFKGGFIGVDIFLVISGYLMGVTLTKSDSFNIVDFYNRRLMRLLPHLVVMLIVCSVLSYILLPPYLLKETAQSSVSAIVSLSNLFFYTQVNYFSPDSLMRPFIHTWSLGLEVQFYILFGLLALLNNRLIFLSLIFFLSVVSFIISVYWVEVLPSAAYFTLPSRFWEFGAGVLFSFNYLNGRFKFSPRVNNLLSSVCLFLILFCAINYYSSLPFPGIAALLPVLSTLWLISSSNNADFLKLSLGWRPLVLIGGLSYGLYLWHQPIFALSRMIFQRDLGFVNIIFCILLAAIISFVGKIYVEDKFRGRDITQPFNFLVYSSCCILFASFGYFATISDGFKNRIANEFDSQPYFYDVNDEKSLALDVWKLVEYDVSSDVPFEQDKDTVNILLIGDSMAYDMAASIHYFSAQQYSKIQVRLVRNDSGCFYLSSDNDICKSTFESVEGIINRLKPDVVGVAALWKKGANLESLQKYFSRWDSLSKSKLVVFGSTGFNDIYSLAYMISSKSEVPSQSEVDNMSFHHRRDKFEDGNVLIEDIATKQGFIYFDRKETFCVLSEQKCRILSYSNSPMIWDNAHLSKTGMEKTFDYFNNNVSVLYESKKVSN